jgi:L-fuconolactonase
LRIDSLHSYSGRHTLEHLGTILKRNRFDGSVLFTSDLEPAPAFVRAIVIRSSRVDPAQLDILQSEPRFRGLYCPGIPEGLAELERRNLSLDAGLAFVPAIARSHPNLRIAFRPGGEVTPAAIAEAAALPNVCCKLAGLFDLAAPLDFVRHALRVFGPGRLMFGSDWPAGLPDHTWKANLALFTQSIGAQTIVVREQLLGRTAARVYGL